MPSYSTEQKRAIRQVVSSTGLSDSQAARYLKLNHFDVKVAISNYHLQESRFPIADLNAIFNSYQSSTDEKDKFGIDGAVKFYSDLGVQLDEIVCVAIAELCKCPAMGEFTRDEFDGGWLDVNCTSIKQMKKHVDHLRTKVPTDKTVFRAVYRYCFLLSRMEGQRNVQYDIAVEQWRMLFNPEAGGVAVNTATTPWLDWWIEFCEQNGKRPISKDLWEQLEVFLTKALQDETLDWWSPDGAWPGSIDEFVGFVKDKRGGNEVMVES